MWLNVLVLIYGLLGYRLVVSLCGNFRLPLNSSRRGLIETIQHLPSDLGAAAVGLSNDILRSRYTEESIDVSLIEPNWIREINNKLETEIDLLNSTTRLKFDGGLKFIISGTELILVSALISLYL